MKKETIPWILFVALMLALQANMDLSNEIYELKANATFKMYNFKEIAPNTKLNGLAVNDEFFCVWTKDRSDKDISDTMLHEWLHIKENRNISVDFSYHGGIPKHA